MTILAVSHQFAMLDVADRAYRIEDGQAVLVADDHLRVKTTSPYDQLQGPAR